MHSNGYDGADPDYQQFVVSADRKNQFTPSLHYFTSLNGTFIDLYILLYRTKIEDMNRLFKILSPLSLVFLLVVLTNAQNNTTDENNTKQEPHKYGGWYCPDNLGGFPAVDIDNWESVPVVNGRMPTKEETQNGTSLIFVDQDKYPDAKPVDMEMPRLARYYNDYSRKNELVIIIQAVQIADDAIVGFRYLNGGNGSARLSEVRFLDEGEIDEISSSRFVTLDIKINATKAQIWDVLTKPEYMQTLKAIFDKENAFMPSSGEGTKVNYAYAKGGGITSAFAGDLFGNQYIQIDCEHGEYQYVQKFLVSENEEAKISDLHIVCGPYEDDYESQKAILMDWAQKVKELSEEK